MKTDNPRLVGMHCFEAAGLGKAPFRVNRFDTIKFQSCPGAPILPGSTCDYCGTGIMYVCYIKSSDGKEFKVGCDCVNKTHDEGLIKAYKRTKEYRDHQKALRQAKDDANRAEIERILADETLRNILATSAFTSHYHNGVSREDNYLAAAERSLPWCGAKGRSEWLKTFKRILAG